MADLTDILFRANFADNGVTLRNATDETDATTMFGYFARYDDWYEIDSWIEGRFVERFASGAFKKTIKENRDNLVSLFDHGYDFQIGDKPLGPIETLRDETEGPYYDVPLLDSDYNRDFVLPALQGRTMDGRTFGSLLGAKEQRRRTLFVEVRVGDPSLDNTNFMGFGGASGVVRTPVRVPIVRGTRRSTRVPPRTSPSRLAPR